MQTEKTSERATKTARRAVQKLSSTGWLEALARRWERQLREMGRECEQNERMIPRVEVLEACLNELRAEMKERKI